MKTYYSDESTQIDDVDVFSEEDARRMSRGECVPQGRPVRCMSIGKPEVKISNGKAVLQSRITLENVYRTVEFTTGEEYAQYLCYERCDAFLIGLINLAMRERCDIFCEAPVTRSLLHQLRTELVPVLCKNDKALYPVKIVAEAVEAPLHNAGKIGTGCSCGVDSLYAIRSLEEDPDYKVDYLVHNNVGAYTYAGTTAWQTYQQNRDNAQAFATEYGYKLIVTESNFAEAFPQQHLYTHLYSSVFAVYAMQKLWKRFYYASPGCNLHDYFSLKDNHWNDSAKYDLIALPAFSTPSLRICNQGMDVSRYEKIRTLADYPPASKFLNVCLHRGKGACGKCIKCRRTLWILDALDKLDNFSEIFDIAQYRANHSRYMTLLHREHVLGAVMIDEAYEILQGRITLTERARGRLEAALMKAPTPVREFARKAKLITRRILRRA